jgi:hypothetical protein
VSSARRMRADRCRKALSDCERTVRAVVGCTTVALPIAVFALSGTLGEHRLAPADGQTAVIERNLELLRRNGDLPSQRRHVWSVIAHLTRTGTAHAEPLFESWHGEEAVFAASSAEQTPRGIRGFSRASSASASPPSNDDVASQSADAPVLTYTLYNDEAYEHIRHNRLYSREHLERLRRTGPPDFIAGNRSVPPFPTQAIVLKTVWWPVAHDSITALPVWDSEQNPSLRGGNGYIGWRRVVAVDPGSSSQDNSDVRIDFAGRSFLRARRVGLNAFHHVVLDTGLAERVMRDHGAQKAASIALGRALRAGDYLVLVGANLATREIGDWIWAALWWHDRPDEGMFAADRPSDLKAEWRNYLLQVAFDSDIPAAVDGGPHICFNPWLEGRFPDGGHGGGTVSNCMTCHRRASYPEVSFLPVTRGDTNLTNDYAFAPGRLRTSFLWSIPLHATR